MAGEAKHSLATLKESLMNVERTERVLALEVRPQKYGFAVLESSVGLLDWGIRSCRNGQITRPGGIDSLLQVYAPHFIVIRRREHNSRRAANAVRVVTINITTKARAYSVKTIFIRGRKIRHFFERYGCTNKYEIASLLAEWFDEIRWKLPTKRRPWESEKYNSLVFDGVATGIAFFGERVVRC